MLGIATGKYTIIRGTDTIDDYGDEIQSLTEVHTGVLGSVIEVNKSVFNPVDNRVATVRQLRGRFKSGTDIQDGDRIRDEKSGQTFVVSAVNQGTDLFNKADLILDLTHS